MIAKVQFTPAQFLPGSDTSDARNVTRDMRLRITLDRRGISDLIHALASCIDGASAASIPSHHGTINVEICEAAITPRADGTALIALTEAERRLLVNVIEDEPQEMINTVLKTVREKLS